MLEFPIAIRSRLLPFGDNPSLLLQTMQRGIERAVLHLQKIACGPLNVLADLMAVSRSMKKRPQDEHVKSALKQTNTLLFQICTEDSLPSMMRVDARPSLGQEERLNVDCRITHINVISIRGSRSAMLEEIVQRLGLESGVSAVSWELAAQEVE
jgi:hypothetical protein